MENNDVTQRQTKMIQFRISEEQFDKLKSSAETYGLSPSLYAKQIAQKSRLKKPHFPHEQTKQIALELTRQGTNLNQIAKKLNQLNVSEADQEKLIEALRYTYGVLAQTQKEYNQLWQQLRK